MSDFKALKKSASSNLTKLTKALDDMNKSNNPGAKNPDEYWKLSVDKSGSGYAVIRFLPVAPADSKDDNALEWVKFWDHGFEGPGGWYIEKSLSTLGKDDPLMVYNRELWESGIKTNKDFVSQKSKRRLHYVSNIYVVKDPANPDNNGKVFKFEYGQKIFDRLMQKMKPKLDIDVAVDPFDLWNGANFVLKALTVNDQRSYDTSEWQAPGPLSKDDDELEAIWKQEYSLLELLDPKNFKTYEELEARLKRVLGQSAAPKHKTAEEYTSKKVDEDFDEELPFTPSPKATSKVVSDDSDDDLDYYESLIGDD